jgi:mRNA interferase HigB
MRIITRAALRDFWEVHTDSEQALKTWFQVTKGIDWQSSEHIRQLYPNVKLSFLKNNRIVFGIKGNSYRLVVKAEYDKRLVFIRFVGTHAEYDRIDANTI